MQQYTRTKNSDALQLATSKSPDSKALDDARKNLLYYSTFRQFGELLNFQGYPADPVSVNGGINGGGQNNFYIIFPVVKPSAGLKIRIGIEATHWENTYVPGSDNILARWDGGSSTYLSNNTYSASNDQRNDISSPPAGPKLLDCQKIEYNRNQSGEYGYTKFSYQNLCPATFTAFTMPLTFSEFSEQDLGNWGVPQYYCDEDAFNIGQTIRGKDLFADTNGSLGEMVQRGGAPDNSTEESNAVDNSAYCLFQWGHPAGRFIMDTAGGTLEYSDMFGTTIKVAPRGLKSSSDPAQNVCTVVAVMRGNSGAGVRVTANTGDSVTYTLAADQTTPALFTIGDIEISAGGDQLTFEGHVSNTLGIEIQTIAVFEKHNAF